MQHPLPQSLQGTRRGNEIPPSPILAVVLVVDSQRRGSVRVALAVGRVGEGDGRVIGATG
jgi:hypothetical protein